MLNTTLTILYSFAALSLTSRRAAFILSDKRLRDHTVLNTSMSALEIGRPKRRLVPGMGFVVILLVVLLGVGGYFVIPRFEWHKPQIKITPDSDTIGLSPLEISVTEQGTGLKSFTATLTSGGTEYPLVSEEYDQPVMQKKFPVALSAKLTGLKEGPAVLRVTARYRSLWRFFRGN